jgi:hypothetical protein
LTADERFDVGLFFATDGDPNGDGALLGVCDPNIITALDGGSPQLGSANFINIDQIPVRGVIPQPGDICGDINATHNPQIVTVKVENAACVDSDGDGNVNLPNCTSWRTSGQNDVCDSASFVSASTFDSYPGAPSKCNCDIGFNIPVFVETGTIAVTKSVTANEDATLPANSLPEPGGEFTYQVQTVNTATQTDVTLDRICDDRYGLIVKTAAAPACPVGSIGSINSTTCTVTQLLQADDGVAGGVDTYTCTFKANATSNVPLDVTDTVTVFGHDENNAPVSATASAVVHITDVAPTAEVIKAKDSIVCATVRYKVQVNNLDTVEELTLSKLEDNTFGSLTSVHDDVVATTCVVPQTLQASDGNTTAPEDDTYNCTFDAKFCGSEHKDKVTGTLNDNDNNEITPVSNEVTVTPTP